MQTSKKMLNLPTGLHHWGQINRYCLNQPLSLENSLQIGIIYTLKLVFVFILELKDFIMPMIVEYHHKESMM